MKEEIKIFVVRILIIVCLFLIFFKIINIINWSWWFVTMPFWLGIILTGVLDGLIDVYKFKK